MSELISSEDKLFVIRTVQSNVSGVKIIAFGSRIRGDARQYSDLDIAVDAGRPLTLREQGILADVFAESALVFKVDVVDMHQIEDDFKKIVLKNGVEWR